MVEIVIQIVAAVLGALAIYLVRKAIKIFEEKTGMDLDEKIEAQIEVLVERGVRLAEEYAIMQLKKGRKMTSEEKKSFAARIIRRLLEEKGWSQETLDLETRIDATVNKIYHGHIKSEPREDQPGRI